MKMKKFLILGALVAGLLSASCSKEIVTVYVPAPGVQEQKLVIALSSGSDELSMKSGRPLLSQAADQDIQNVTLYFVNSENSVALVKEVNKGEWNNAVDYDKGKKLEVTLKKSNGEQLADGEYDVYAVGFSDGVTSGTSDAYTFNEISKGDSWDDAAFYATLKGSDAEEVFAGVSTVFAVTASETADMGAYSYLTAVSEGEPDNTPVVVLNRQVAGVTGYFTNIPVSVNGETPAKIRLVASKKYTQVNFTSLYGDETVTGTTKTYVVNGSVESSETKVPFWNNDNQGFTVYEMLLSDWFKFGAADTESQRTTFADCDLNGDGYVGWLDALCYVYNKTGEAGDASSDFDTANWATDYKGENGCKALSNFWVNPNSAEYPQQLVAGSLFAGRFVIPFDYATGVNTLELQLLGENDVILKNWNVKVDQMTTAETQTTPTGTVAKPDESYYVYNIYRNHMYSLGSKGLDYDPDQPGLDPEDPDPDPKPEPDPDDPDSPDDPQDLNTTMDLQIHVNDQWEIIHNMEID